jgi:transposase
LIENEALRAENQTLNAELATVKAQIQADSHNSHQPPAADGLRKRPALPKSSTGKRGGQPGHPGKTLKMVAHPDHTIACPPAMWACGVSLRAASGTVIERRQVFDVPEPRFTVTEYQRLRCQCPVCGQVSEGVFPLQVTAPTHYGDGVAALATMLSTEYALPVKKIQRLFTDLDGYALNERTSVHAQETCYAALAPSEAVLKAQVLASPVCHFDETGIRVARRRHWQHVASTADATYLFVHPHRGTRALRSGDSLLPTYTGGGGA